MDIIPLASEQDNIWTQIEHTEKTLRGLWVSVHQDYALSIDEIRQIHAVANTHDCLTSSNHESYQKDAKNGMLKLKRGSELVWYIFAYRWEVEDIGFFERGSLWVDTSLSGNELWKYLMLKMTEKLSGKNILSVTSNIVVQNVNELLMDYEIINPAWVVKEMIEKRWAMKDDYRYFINEKLMKIL